jgi:hypothetical protein
MTNREVARRLQQLKALSSKAGNASVSDIELIAHWAKYLCVLTAGFLEVALEEIYSDYIKRNANQATAKFAISMLGRFQNPKASQFLEIAQHFKESWRSDLETFLEEGGRKDAVNSIMANRHQIAHGEYSGITLARVIDYLDKCVEVIEFIETQCRDA